MSQETTDDNTLRDDHGRSARERPTKVDVYGIAEDAQFVGPYEILEILGHGGQATVYRARDRRVQRIVALKVLREFAGATSEMLLRFRREAELTAKLDHPSICPIYEVGLDAVPFIAMKLVSGKTLAQRIAAAKADSGSNKTAMKSFVDLEISDDSTAAIDRREIVASAETPPRPESRSGSPQGRENIFGVLRVIEEVARALDLAHEAGIVHRDIKPGNLMIQNDGRPVILDFGLAFHEDHAGPSLSVTGQLLGTPAYMAPEQISAEKRRIDRRADVFSLGVTLFELLTLVRPFEGATRDALYHAILDSDPHDPRRLNPSISADLGVVMLKALEKEPDARFATALEFAEELHRIRSFLPIKTRPVGFLRRHLRWVQRNPGWAVALYGIFVALSLAVGVFSIKNAELDRANALLESERTALARKTSEAEANARRARDEAAAKSEAIREYDRLADSTLFAQAKAEADELFPVGPELVTKIEAWRAKYAPLFRNITIHEATLQRLQESAAPYGETARAADYPAESRKLKELANLARAARARADNSKSDEDLDMAAADAEEAFEDARKAYFNLPRKTADFGADTKVQFQHDVLADLVQKMRAFGAKDGEAADLEERLARSKEIRKLTIDDHKDAWTAAIARVAANPKYAGYSLREDVGLVPLGADRESSLEEFFEIQTGEPPTRDENGRIIVGEKTAIVFVLIPPGTFQMGAQSDDATAANFDPEMIEGEGPVHEVLLSAFFISKYEMTQGQWVRTSRGAKKNPSNWTQANYPGLAAVPTDLRHPVEQVSWDDCRERLRRLGYVLPTEAQWEYAARAGTQSASYWSKERGSLDRYENSADRSYHKLFASSPYDDRLEDRWAATAPVGTYLPNAFGLFDMLGNVFEWCEDAYSPFSAAPHRPGDGLRESTDQSQRIIRGGSFVTRAKTARSANRSRYDPSVRASSTGFRPVRPTAGE